MTIQKFIHLFPFLLIFLILSSCGGNIGYGTLLWSTDEENFPTGSVVRILSEYPLSGNYSIKNIGTKKTMEIPIPRIEFFKTKKDALIFADKYKPFIQVVGISESDGLPIRKTEDALGERIYRLQIGKKVKIIGRNDTKVKIGALEGFWYKVLTDDGVTGYCFSSSLTITSTIDIPEDSTAGVSNNAVDIFLNSVWRPEYFKEMIENNQIDLTRFKKTFGLFPDPKKKTIYINTEEHTELFSYSDIIPIRSGSYQIGNTPIEIHFIDDYTIELINTKQNNMFTQQFTRTHQDIDQITTQEIKRREDLYNSITENGTTLKSSAYGEITFTKYPLFSWTDFDRLPPEIIPPGAVHAGRVDFSVFSSEAIRGPYTGIITFNFGENSDKQVSNFLYEITGSGLRLTFIPLGNLDGNILSSLPGTPVVLFFSNSLED